MRDILVIRFGALGDLCVLGWALSRLADSCAPGTCRITLVTKGGGQYCTKYLRMRQAFVKERIDAGEATVQALGEVFFR